MQKSSVIDVMGETFMSTRSGKHREKAIELQEILERTQAVALGPLARFTKLTPDYYRSRADLCFKLADTALAAKPIAARLVFLAGEYLTKVRALESTMNAGDPFANVK